MKKANKTKKKRKEKRKSGESKLKTDYRIYGLPSSAHITLTSPGMKAFVASYTLSDLLHFIIDTTLTYEANSPDNTLTVDSPNAELKKAQEDFFKLIPGKRMKFLLSRLPTLYELFLCRIVDNFTTYLSEIIGEVLKAKPQMLKSKEQVTVDYIMQFDSLEDLRIDLIDRKVMNLSYKGFEDLSAWCEARFGVPILWTGDSGRKIIEILETRNILVHNRGIVNSKFLHAVPNSTLKAGDRVSLKLSTVFNLQQVVCNTMEDFDGRISEKFKLKRKEFSNEFDKLHSKGRHWFLNGISQG